MIHNYRCPRVAYLKLQPQHVRRSTRHIHDTHKWDGLHTRGTYSRRSAQTRTNTSANSAEIRCPGVHRHAHDLSQFMKTPISVKEGPTLANYHLLLSAIRDKSICPGQIPSSISTTSLDLGLGLQGRFLFRFGTYPGKWETRCPPRRQSPVSRRKLKVGIGNYEIHRRRGCRGPRACSREVAIDRR